MQTTKTLESDPKTKKLQNSFKILCCLSFHVGICEKKQTNKHLKVKIECEQKYREKIDKDRIKAIRGRLLYETIIA